MIHEKVITLTHGFAQIREKKFWSNLNSDIISVYYYSYSLLDWPDIEP